MKFFAYLPQYELWVTPMLLPLSPDGTISGDATFPHIKGIPEIPVMDLTECPVVIIDDNEGVHVINKEKLPPNTVYIDLGPEELEYYGCDRTDMHFGTFVKEYPGIGRYCEVNVQPSMEKVAALWTVGWHRETYSLPAFHLTKLN